MKNGKGRLSEMRIVKSDWQAARTGRAGRGGVAFLNLYAGCPAHLN